jgi:hypothetical protein
MKMMDQIKLQERYTAGDFADEKPATPKPAPKPAPAKAKGK